VKEAVVKSPFTTGYGSVRETWTVPDPVFTYETLNGFWY
jgi:hypothetical protein